MVSEYLSSEVNKILEKGKDPLNMALASSFTIINFKGLDVQILSMNEISSLADFFVLASVKNHVQAQSILDTLTRLFRNQQISICGREGETQSNWFLLDTGDVIVHLVLEGARQVYRFDQLWDKAPKIEIPKEYYFSSTHHSIKEDDDSYEEYF